MDKIYTLISTAFCVIVILSNAVSAKMVLVLQGFSVPAGLLFYPFCFLLSDFVTEIFGADRAKRMVYMAFGMSVLGYGVIQTTLCMPSADPEMERMFQTVFGLNGTVLFGSITAFIVSQIVDIQLYAQIKRWTGPKFLWLRNNGATITAELIDTAIVNLVHLYWGMGMDIENVLPIMLFSYIYKSTFNVLLTPFFYFLVSFSRRNRLTFNDVKG